MIRSILLGNLRGGIAGCAIACIHVWQTCSNPEYDCSPGYGLLMYAPTFSVIGILLGGVVGTLAGLIKSRGNKLG